MYNMEISIGSYKFRLEILILIVIVYIIMFGHTLCGCSRVGLLEGMEIVKNSVRGPRNSLVDDADVRPRVAARAREGFVGSNNSASAPEFAAAQSSGYIMDPSTWAMPTLTYSPGTTPDAGVKEIWNRPKQPIPLPEGQLSLFATTDFKPSCCPNAFSTSTGCACMDLKTYSYLRDRGGNNVPYSEY